MKTETNMERMWLRTPGIISEILRVVVMMAFMSPLFFAETNNAYIMFSLFICLLIAGIIAAEVTSRRAKAEMVTARMRQWSRDRFDSWEDFYEWFEETDPEEIDLVIGIDTMWSSKDEE